MKDPDMQDCDRVAASWRSVVCGPKANFLAAGVVSVTHSHHLWGLLRGLVLPSGTEDLRNKEACIRHYNDPLQTFPIFSLLLTKGGQAWVVSLAQSARRTSPEPTWVDNMPRLAVQAQFCFKSVAVVETTRANLLRWPHASIWFATTCAQQLTCDAESFRTKWWQLGDFDEICSTKRDPSVVNARHVYRMIKGVWPSTFLHFVAHYAN